ncbi:MAG: glycosyltransferase family 1 protein [Bacteroidales bacterium]
MKIAIEAQRIFRTKKHGMDFVVLETIKQLQKIDLVNEYYIIAAPGKDRSVLLESSNFYIIEINCPTYPLWEQFALPMAIKRIKPDILHCTSNTAPLICSVPLIITLHDIIFLEKRDVRSKSLYQNLGWYYRKLVVPRILKKCRLIITVSEFEKRIIQQKLNLTDIVVSEYNGYGSHFKVIEDVQPVLNNYLKQTEYLFFLGNTDPKKNTLRVLKAYAIYIKKVKNPRKLVIADLTEEDIKRIVQNNEIDSQVLSNIITIGYISNKDLPYIYNAAYLFLYPSLRESFGIPQLEAMACGTPVITSNISAMPEISGDAAIYTNPYDEGSIAEAIVRMEDVTLHREYVMRGLKRVVFFSWENTAIQIHNHYNSMQDVK